MSVVALWSPSDLVLSILAPLAVAASRPPCLVVDLDPNGPRFSAGPTLAELVADGPTADQLAPKRSGVSVLGNGGVRAGDAEDVVAALGRRWPSLVLRCPPTEPAPPAAIALIPLLPGPLALRTDPHRTILQRVGLRVDVPDGIPVVREPRPSTLRALASMRMPVRSRWVRQLGQIWSPT
ncbi:MAG: hypothetical protein KDB69_02365 [Acidimicrobiia bacterium]|nr:hypothetical protein [Acidimicrobiia bacterium]